MKRVIIIIIIMFFVVSVVAVSTLLIVRARTSSDNRKNELDPYVRKIMEYVDDKTKGKEEVSCVFRMDEITDFDWDFLIYTYYRYPKEPLLSELGVQSVDDGTYLYDITFVSEGQIVYQLKDAPKRLDYAERPFVWSYLNEEPYYYVFSREDAVFEGEITPAQYLEPPNKGLIYPGDYAIFPHVRRSVDNVNLLQRGMSIEEVVEIIGKADGEQLNPIPQMNPGDILEWCYSFETRMELCVHLKFVCIEGHGSFLDSAWLEQKEQLKETFFDASDPKGTAISWVWEE